ncbi:MAG: hypothetical protein OEZ08_18530 [Betaproteobacteria bacterium]|nr:hypothetical protein [Betaproteobacteria bacterium]
MKNLLRLKVCVIAALGATAVGAQGTRFPHPADAAVAASPPRYDSAFAGYASYRDEKLAPWREVNDEVARVGGHIGILRGNGTAAPRTPAPPQSTPSAESR